jgi:SAM-dependent methyltransferase
LSVDTLITAMTTGGRADGRTAAGYLFHSAQICTAIAGCGTVVDLGCGTGEQLLQVAELNPATRFVGVDRSQSMLDVAAARARERQLDNVEFLRAELADLRDLQTASVDAVVSTMTLHHLPDTGAAAACLDEMRRILRPGGAVYIEDFGRLRSAKSIDYFVLRSDAGAPDAFSSLYRASLHAAFAAAELRDLAAAHLPEEVRFPRTVPIPFLIVLATPPRGRLS